LVKIIRTALILEVDSWDR